MIPCQTWQQYIKKREELLHRISNGDKDAERELVLLELGFSAGMALMEVDSGK
jgi:hypothetical protein